MKSPSKNWHENDNFWKAAAPFLFNKKRVANTPAEVKQIVKLLTLPARSKILDLGCGIGRHAIGLAKRGFIVTGVDRNDFFLKRARKEAGAKKRSVKFTKKDMRHFCRPNFFDGAINISSTFGYFNKEKDNQQVLVNLGLSLRPGGMLLMEMVSPDVLQRSFRSKHWVIENRNYLLEERKMSEDKKWLHTFWTILRGKNKNELSFSMQIYSNKELTSLLKKCGFHHIQFFGSLSGTPYDSSAMRRIVVAKKK